MYKSEKGVTLSMLVITIIVLLILTSVTLMSANQYLGASKLVNFENDIKVLQEAIPIYYEEHNSLPTKGSVLPTSLVSKFGNQKNVNDNSEYYVIDLTLLPDVNLNYGHGTGSSTDCFVVNTGSFAVYYFAGLNIEGTMHYTLTQTDTTVNSTIQAPGDFSFSTSVTATSITVNGSTSSTYGIKGYRFSINNNGWSSLQASGEYTFTGLTTGTTYIISMQAVDNNGNIYVADSKSVTTSTAVNALSTSSLRSKAKLSVASTQQFVVNAPDMRNLPATTKYVLWTDTTPFTPEEYDSEPADWYDYSTGKWANIKTTSSDASLEAYWVWIPRFAYKLPESDSAKQMDVIFVKDNGTKGVLQDGSTVECLYATDYDITSDASGTYVNKTMDAVDNWIIHPAFTFGDTQLSGIWVAKFEASSNNPIATDGGGNVTDLSVQVKPDVTSWRNISLSNIMSVCRAMLTTSGALGTTSANFDVHPSKNMEWAAVAILSQSQYGIFNVSSNNRDDEKIWNNPSVSMITGRVGNSSSASQVQDESCISYNSVNGTKASTTGTVYGVYDMAGGAWEYVMGVQASSGSTPTTSSTEFIIWPNAKYYDLYTSGNSNLDYTRGKIGDLTRELNPSSGTGLSWNNDAARFVYTDAPIFLRGNNYTGADNSGIFAFGVDNGAGNENYTFRPVFVNI